MSFTWIPFYKEFAHKLLEYKNRRQELVETIYSALDNTQNDSGTSVVNYFKKDKEERLTDTDPFSVFAIFNRTTNDKVRKECVTILKECFHITATVPSDFDGIPVLNAQKSIFVYQNGNTVEQDNSLLWNLFEKAVNNEDFEQEYDEALKIKGVNNNLSMGLFWICPDRFLALDSQNRNYIKQKLGLEISDKPNYQEYEELLNKVRTSLYEDFAELSLQAWKCSKNKEVEEMNDNKNYWLLGHAFGKNNPQFKRFIVNGIWEGWFDINKPVDQRQLSLARQIKVGDVILLKSTSTKGVKHDIPFLRIKAIGIVESKIREIDNGNSHVINCEVKYISTNDKDFEGVSYGAYRQTVHKADEKVKAVIDYANSVINLNENPMKKYSEYIDLLKENHNLVLTGAPGTGKTFMAKAIAEEMGCSNDEMCFVQFHPSYDYTDFVEGLRPIDKSDGQVGFERKDGVFKEFCKKALKNIVDSKKSIESLSKELSWEEKLQDFIEDAIENNTKFILSNKSEFSIEDIKGRVIVVHNEQNEKTNRIYVNADDIIQLLSNEVPLNYVRDIRTFFKRKFGSQPDSYAYIITKEIRKKKNNKVVLSSVNKIDLKPFVFIIDEINRGEISKIFGELFFSIDPGYRGEKGKVKTQYQNMVSEGDVFADGFYVPENVYIIGTMNDIDRSVESMDFAMRRRFTWIEISAESQKDMLDSLGEYAQEAKDSMTALNQVIEGTPELGKAYEIGPAYFLKLKNCNYDFDSLWKMNIEPLLREYLRGYRNGKEIIENCKNAYDLKKKEGEQ